MFVSDQRDPDESALLRMASNADATPTTGFVGLSSSAAWFELTAVAESGPPAIVKGVADRINC